MCLSVRRDVDPAELGFVEVEYFAQLLGELHGVAALFGDEIG